MLLCFLFGSDRFPKFESNDNFSTWAFDFPLLRTIYHLMCYIVYNRCSDNLFGIAWLQHSFMTLLQFFDGFYTLILFCRSLLLPVVDPPTYYYADDYSNSNTEICTRCVCHINTILCYFRQTSPDCKNLKYRNTIMPNLNVIICAHLRFKRHVLGLFLMILLSSVAQT